MKSYIKGNEQQSVMSQCKRRRTDCAPEAQNRFDLEQELKQLSAEVEPVSVCRPDQPPIYGYRSTYRATLAKKGYVVRNYIGSGSYSKVKVAHNVKGVGAEKVAVKIIDRVKAPHDYQLKFLPRELRFWPHLTHPNLVHLHEVFSDSRKVYIVLELAECGDTLKYIQAHSAVSEKLARKWCLQTADAVQYMHEKDIAHRDLKLENLLLDKHQNIKVCDFGFIKPHSSSDLSRTYCGSKSYAAPDILRGQPYDPKKADVWAMGVILYIMVTGKMPFDETKGTKSILEEHRKLEFRWPEHYISDQCKALIRRMFTWDYIKRPSVHDVLCDPWFHIKKEPHIKEQIDLSAPSTSSTYTYNPRRHSNCSCCQKSKGHAGNGCKKTQSCI